MKFKTLFLALVFIFSVAGTCFAQSITIKGSTTVFPIMEAVVQAYAKIKPHVKIHLTASGSGNGIKALLASDTDIAMSSRDVKNSEAQRAASIGMEPIMTAIALDAVVPITHPANPVGDISTGQLAGIYSCGITGWKDMNGNEAAIDVYSRDHTSGTFETWKKIVLVKKKLCQEVIHLSSNQDMVKAVSRDENAIGYVGLGYLSDKVKGLSVNGVKATPESVRGGQYPIARKLYLLTGSFPKPSVQKLIDFIMSPAGQSLVAKAGFVPIK